MKVHVIIPVAPGDLSWRRLLQSGQLNRSDYSVILSVADSASAEDWRYYKEASEDCVLVSGPQGRGKQLNRGAWAASSGYLWFVHGDSILDEHCLRAVDQVLLQEKDALYYFDLKFEREGMQPMIVNEIGVRVRSRLLKLPFGDQGFLIKRKLFEDLGGFQEDCSYGEDHLFVWKCHQAKVPVSAIGSDIITSARKYRDRGWLQTTCKHLYLTAKQAQPEFMNLVRRPWM